PEAERVGQPDRHRRLPLARGRWVDPGDQDELPLRLAAGADRLEGDLGLVAPVRLDLVLGETQLRRDLDDRLELGGLRDLNVREHGNPQSEVLPSCDAGPAPVLTRGAGDNESAGRAPRTLERAGPARRAILCSGRDPGKSRRGRMGRARRDGRRVQASGGGTGGARGGRAARAAAVRAAPQPSTRTRRITMGFQFSGKGGGGSWPGTTTAYSGAGPSTI